MELKNLSYNKANRNQSSLTWLIFVGSLMRYWRCYAHLNSVKKKSSWTISHTLNLRNIYQWQIKQFYPAKSKLISLLNVLPWIQFLLENYYLYKKKCTLSTVVYNAIVCYEKEWISMSFIYFSFSVYWSALARFFLFLLSNSTFLSKNDATKSWIWPSKWYQREKKMFLTRIFSIVKPSSKNVFFAIQKTTYKC